MMCCFVELILEEYRVTSVDVTLGGSKTQYNFAFLSLLIGHCSFLFLFSFLMFMVRLLVTFCDTLRIFFPCFLFLFCLMFLVIFHLQPFQSPSPIFIFWFKRPDSFFFFFFFLFLVREFNAFVSILNFHGLFIISLAE